jgi:hypothetical protein
VKESTEEVIRMRLTHAQLDPFPIDAGPLEKHQHHFEDNARVTVISGAHKGRSGKLEGINAHGGHLVRLDSGNLVEYLHAELEPEDFPPAGISAAPSGDLLGDLENALLSGRVSASDRLTIEREIRKIKGGGNEVVPFAGIDPPHEIPVDPRFPVLEGLAKKYGAESLAKRRKPRTDLKRGQKVRHPVRNEVGTITSIEDVVIKIAYPSGEMIALDHTVQIAA